MLGQTVGGVIYIYTTHYKHTPTLPNMGYVFGDRLPAMYIDLGLRYIGVYLFGRMYRR